MKKKLFLAVAMAAVMVISQTKAGAQDAMILGQPSFVTTGFGEPASQPTLATPQPAPARNAASQRQPDPAEAPLPQPAPDPAISLDGAECPACHSYDCRCRCWTPGVFVEATFLWPSLEGNSAVSQWLDTGDGSIAAFPGSLAGTDDFTVAPRIWVGAKRDCWGIGSRLWWMEETGTAFDSIGLDPDRFSATGSLEAYLIDLELTRELPIGCADTQLAFGARYGYLQSAEVTNSAAFTGTVLSTATASTMSQFGGTGISLGWEGTRPMKRFCHLNWFWNLRGSILWGDGSAGAVTSASAISAGGSGLAENFAVAGNNGDLFIGEMQLGVQYERPLRCAPCTAFIRGAFEYQYWDMGTDIFAASTSLATVGTVSSSATAVAGDLNMDLYGFTVGTGLKW